METYILNLVNLIYFCCFYSLKRLCDKSLKERCICNRFVISSPTSCNQRLCAANYHVMDCINANDATIKMQTLCFLSLLRNNPFVNVKFYILDYMISVCISVLLIKKLRWYMNQAFGN